MNKQFEDDMQSLLKDEYIDFMQALKQPETKAFYINPLKPNALSFLNNNKITRHPLIDNGYYFDYKHYPLGKSPFFSCGLYYIQEPSAMLVTHFLDIKEDDYILDMCAAPGGKTCSTATRLSHKGLLIANDFVPLRAKILSENIERLGIQNTIVTNSHPRTFEKELSSFFDKIIVDAPCSGEGMFRKTTKAIDTWSMKKREECMHIQRELLDTAMQLLKAGGQIIYSTCTYNIDENEKQVRYLLDHYDCTLIPLCKSHGMQPGIDMPEAIRLYPHHYQGEGHFIALIQKNGSQKAHKTTLIKPSITKNNQNLVKTFYQNYLNIPVPIHLHENNHHIYAVQPHFPELKNIRILRRGLYLGECKKNHFKPSLALALTLHKKDVKQFYCFHEDAPEIARYLHGETLDGTTQQGYGVIFVEDFPLSFYKESHHQVKNLYPKGLRQ